MESEKSTRHYPCPPGPEFIARMAERREALRTELARILPSQARFVWEVGCGHGHFLTAYAEANRDQLCVGIDIILERVRRGAKKRDRAVLENLHFVRAEAKLFLEEMPTSARFTAVYILFPDPWPKKRHHKNRIMQPEFLHDVAVRAEPGTPLYFRTDFAPYFEEARERVQGHLDWELLPDASSWPFELETVFQAKARSYQSLVALRR